MLNATYRTRRLLPCLALGLGGLLFGVGMGFGGAWIATVVGLAGLAIVIQILIALTIVGLAGGVLAPNGCIYLASCDAGQTLCMNPKA